MNYYNKITQLVEGSMGLAKTDRLFSKAYKNLDAHGGPSKFSRRGTKKLKLAKQKDKNARLKLRSQDGERQTRVLSRHPERK